MCGICGIYSEHGVDETVLHSMADRLRHRGPDDEGFFVDTHVGLANRRLSIIDLDTGRQPISNEDGTLTVVFNGEIYNFASLRQELQQKGHVFRTHTDTEVIVHLYEEHGSRCVERLNGMFAVAISDQKTRELFIARDALGQKPLYFCRANGGLVFASEIKSLLAHPAVSASVDSHGLHHCLSLRCVPEMGTLFEGVEKLPAGHRMIFRNGELEVERYWDLQYRPKIEGSEQEIIEQLRDLLQETVASHLVSDVPLGAFLSGGIDSSLVVAMMSRASGRPVKTFSIGVLEEDFNELPYARLLADRYKTEHYEAMARPDWITLLPEMIYYMEEPVDPFAFGVYSASQLAAEHVKVVLGGDGGDEMFAGYDRYLGNRLVDLYCLLPVPVRRHVIEPLIARLPDSYRYNNRVQKLRWLVAMSGTQAGRRYAESASFLRFTHERKEMLYAEPLWRQLGGVRSAEVLTRYFEMNNASDDVDRMLYTDVRSRLAEHLLMVADRMTMAHSIEGRSPYVDQRVAEFAARIPASLKVHGRRLKHVQREVARGLLPETLITRKKKGFGFPLAYWFRNELRDVTAELLGHGSLAGCGYFRAESMIAMLDEHASGKMDHNYRLWLLLNLELWHRMFIEGQSREDLEEALRGCMSHPRSGPQIGNEPCGIKR